MSNCQTPVEPIQNWIKAKLMAKDDRAISDYIKNAGPKDFDSTRRLLRSLVETQVIKIGNSAYLTQLFAIPVRISVEEGCSFPNIQDLDVSALMRSMIRTKVITRNDCIVLLNGMAPREFIETTTPSALYDVARTMFMASTSTSEVGGNLNLGNDQINVIALPNGKMTAQLFIVGLHRWKHGTSPSLILKNNPATFGRWKQYAKEIICFSVANPHQKPAEIEIDNIAPLFQAFANGNQAMMEFALKKTCEHLQEEGVTDCSTTFQLSSSSYSPTTFELTVDLHVGEDETKNFSYEMTLCERTGDSVTDTVSRITDLLKTYGITVGGLNSTWLN